MMTRRLRNRNRRGAVLPLVAVVLIALFSMLALAIDLGLVVVARTQCQNAADAAAMAGVRELNGDQANDNNYTAAAPTAKASAKENKILKESFTDEQITVKVGYYTYVTADKKFEAKFTGTKPDEENWSAVQVDVTTNKATVFAKIFNAPGFTAGASATAVHRPRDIAVVLDFSSSMRYSSDVAYPYQGNYSGSLNPDPDYPKFGHWTSMASQMQKTTNYEESDGDVHAPNNYTMETDNGPPIVKDFLYRDASDGNKLKNAFHRVLTTYDANTWACPAPADWDLQSSTTQTYVGDQWPRKNNSSSNTWAATVQEFLLNTNNSSTYTSATHAKLTTNKPSGVYGPTTGTRPFDPANHNAPTTSEGYGPNFKGYSMGPGYYGKTFYIWPPDPRWHQTDTTTAVLRSDWRKKFFFNGGSTTAALGDSGSSTGDNRADNSKLWDTSTELWKQAGSSTYAVNYTAIMNWIASGPQVLPPNLRAGRLLYYSSMPTTIPQTGGTDDQKFWRSYIDYVIGNGSDTMQRRTLYGRNETAWGTAKITAKSSLSTTASTRPYMHYNDNPIRPRLQFWFGPLSMVCFLHRNYDSGYNRNWFPGTCHESQCWQLKAGINAAFDDIKKNHPNDWASLIFFSSLSDYTQERVPLGRNYTALKNALFYPMSVLTTLGTDTTEIRPYNSSLTDTTPGDVPNANGQTSPECGFKVAYNQLSHLNSGRKGASKMVIFETDGVPNSSCSGSIVNGLYTNLTVGSNVGNGNSTVLTNALNTVSQICALDTANPPGYSTTKVPARVHAIGFGDIFSSNSDYKDDALDFLLKVQQRGNTSSTAVGATLESYKIITGNYTTRIGNLKTAIERIMQSGIQVSLIK